MFTRYMYLFCIRDSFKTMEKFLIIKDFGRKNITFYKSKGGGRKRICVNGSIVRGVIRQHRLPYRKPVKGKSYKGK